MHKLLRINYILGIRKGNASITTSSCPAENCNESPVVVEKDDHITLIGLNRPTKRNSINLETIHRLHEVLTDFEADKSSPVAVLYGLGGSFCAGQDITELEEQCRNMNLSEFFKDTCNIDMMRKHSSKPIVCGINGYCVANGLELAMFCDLRVMEDTAVLGFFGRPAGLNLRSGGIARLPALIGYSRSMDLLLTGRSVHAKEALEMGLVNRLVATGTSLGQAVNLAFSIAKFPLAAQQRDRSILYRNSYERRRGFHAAIAQETAPLTSTVLHEIKEGVQRFKSSKYKEPKAGSWLVKPKVIPDWEKEEILYEQRNALNVKSKGGLVQ